MKKTLIIVIAVAVLAGMGFWAYSLWNAPVPSAVDFKPLTPEQRAALFEELEKSSTEKPIPVEEIHQVFSELEKESTAPTVTADEKADMFKVLEETSVR